MRESGNLDLYVASHGVVDAGRHEWLGDCARLQDLTLAPLLAPLTRFATVHFEGV